MRIWKIFFVSSLVILPIFMEADISIPTAQQITQIENKTSIDISKHSEDTQKEFLSIFNDLKKRGNLNKLNKNSLQNLLTAIEIKNSAVLDLDELKKWFKNFNQYIASSWISSKRWKNRLIYKYFYEKIKFFNKIWNDYELVNLIVDWEKEFIENWGKWALYYMILNNFTIDNIKSIFYDKINERSPNFFRKISENVLNGKYLNVFSNQFYEDIKGRKEIEKDKKEIEKDKKEIDLAKKILKVFE